MVESLDVLMIVAICFGIICGGISLYYALVIDPKEKQNYDNQKILLDSMSCSQLGDWVVNNSKNSTYSSGGYINPNYPYAQAKFIQCTHATQLGEKP